MKNFVRRMFRWMPTPLKARLDYTFDKSLGKEFGGPFNGQSARQQIFKDLMKKVSFKAIVETGTFRGVTTEFMAKESGLPVYTVELLERFYYYAKLNLKAQKNVHVRLGDSRAFIENLSQDIEVPKKYVFFYLDAHWQDDLPLYKEIELIGNNWKNVVIMIDDFEVPGDPGYQYDNYGEGKKLSLDYIAPLLERKWSVFFPAAASSEETSIKRGSIILASPELEAELRNIPSLRIFFKMNIAELRETSVS